MYKKSAMEERKAPIVEEIEKRNRGEVARESTGQKSSRFKMIKMVNDFIGGRLAKLKGAKKRSAYGTHNIKSNWIRLGESTDVDTLFHELGHYIRRVIFEDAFNNETINEEIRKIDADYYDKLHENEPEKQLEEGFAEAVRRYITAREELVAKYPNIVDLFDNLRNDSKEGQKAFELVDKLSEEVHNYINMEPEDLLRAAWRRNPDDPSGKEQVNVEGFWEHLGTKLSKILFNAEVYLNKADRWIADATGKPYRELLSSEKLEDTFRLSGNMGRIAFQLLHGIRDYGNFGKKITHGFDEIFDSLRPTKEEAKAEGMKVGELWQKNIEDAMTYGLALRLADLYTGKRKLQSMGVSLSTVAKVVDKYKNNAKFNKAVKLINENSRAILQYSYEQGIITKEKMEQMINDNFFYFPLNRVQMENDLGKKTFGYHSQGRPFYHLTGSDELIENPLISLASNWGTLLRKIEENNMMKHLVSTMEKIKGHGIWFTTDVPPEVQKRATATLNNFKGELERQFKAIEEQYKIDIKADVLTDMMDLEATVDLFAPIAENLGERVLSYYDNGHRKYIQFANNEYGNGLFEIYSKMNTETQSDFLNILARINAPLKLGATAWNWEFALSNMQSDAMQRYLYGEGNFLNRVYVPIVTNVRNIVQYLNNKGSGTFARPSSELYEKFVQSGADQSGQFSSNKENLVYGTEKVFGRSSKELFGRPSNDFTDVRDMLRTKGNSALNRLSRGITSTKFADVMNWLPEVSEQSTRFAEFATVYKKMIKQGYSEEVAIREAGMKARQVTQDFTVQGTLMREINKVVPFASATAGGFYRLEQELRNNPVRVSKRLGGLAALTILFSYMMRGEDRDWYDELNAQKKFDNFFLPNPYDKQHPIVIKKPQGTPRYFVNLVQLIYEVEQGYVPEDKISERFYDWLGKSLKDATPISDVSDLTPGALQAFLENAMNKDLFYGTEIVPKSMQDLDPRHQYNENTSEIAKGIGDVFNWSPMKIDNVLKKWFAGLGKQMLNATDTVIRSARGEEVPEKDISEKYMLGKIFANTLRNSSSVNEIYERIDYLNREKAEGRITFEQEQELDKLEDTKTALSKYNKKINAVKVDGSLSSQEKRDKLDSLYEIRTDIARNALGLKLLDSNNKDTVELIRFYPSQDNYTYTAKNKQKIPVSFADESTQIEYATYFKNLYEKEITNLRKTAKYKNASDEEKIKLENDVWTKTKTATTNDMKEKVAKRTK